MYTLMKSYVKPLFIFGLLLCYNILMPDTKEFETQRVQQMEDKNRVASETQQLIEDTMKEVQWKEGTGKDGKHYYAYDDKVKDKSTGKVKSIRTIGNGINMDEEHNRRFLIDLVGEDAFQDMYSGRRPIDMSVNKAAVRYNIQLSLKHAKNAVNNFDSLPYDARLVTTDMFYNVGGNLPKKMPSFINALNRGELVEASMELKHKNPYGKKDKPVDMDTTNYYDQTTGRGKYNFEILNAYKKPKQKKSKVIKDGIIISEGKKEGEIIFNFPAGM